MPWNDHTNPEIFVLGDPNGAGKSTTATVLIPESLSIDQFVNADLIAKGLSPFSPMSSAVDAGRIMLERIHQLRDRNETFAFETTLAGRSYVPFLRDAQDRGYLVHLIFVWISSVELARSRVAVRVRQGGHDVPPQDIERRYWRGLKNFFELYRPLADTWTLCDNSGDELVLIAGGDKGQESTIYENDIFGVIQKMVPHDSQ